MTESGAGAAEPAEGAEQLRATSDALLADLERLLAIEEEKRTIPLGDPRLGEFAAAVEELSQRVLAQSTKQMRMSQATAATLEDGPRPAPSIEDVPPRELRVVLTEWRDAERRAVAADPGTPEATAAAADTRRLREEYHRGLAARSRQDR